ncbi:MAG: PTS glucitol/sorbitol transporter subunit IIC [Propionibacteriaceae bacterium]|nr:PTS glucitol/sorbitol transporter subunit IIC [Propionibacteriaceae bacterium]
MDYIAWFAEHFIGLFRAAGESLMGLITGILPLLLALLTAMYAVTAWIGEERVTRAVRWAGKYAVTRYTIMPMLAAIMLTNPMCYTFGRFLPERYKPAYYDSTASFLHPVTSLLPHANAGELFVWAGVAAGVTQIAPEKYARLAILYFLVGIIVILIRGIFTQWLTRLLIARGGHRETFARFDRLYAEGHLQGSKAEQGAVL